MGGLDRLAADGQCSIDINGNTTPGYRCECVQSWFIWWCFYESSGRMYYLKKKDYCLPVNR